MPTRVGVHLRAVQRDRTHLEHSHRARELQHLQKQCLDLRQEALAKRRNGVVIGMLVASDEAKRHRIVRRTLDRSTGQHLRRIAVDQQSQQHRRAIRRRTRSAILLDQLRQIQSVDNLDNKACQVSLRQPLIHRRGQQKSGVAIDRSKVAHGVH